MRSHLWEWSVPAENGWPGMAWSWWGESFSGLSHALEVVDFYIALKEGLESRGGRIVTWLGERDARYRFRGHGRRLLLSPDGYCLWALGEEEGSFWSGIGERRA